MRCPECSYDNPEGARFCGDCASALAGSVECPRCGSLNPAGQKFCNVCGSSLTESGQAPEPGRDGVRPEAPTPPEHLAQKIRAARGSLESELKQVTVLFADIKGSMALAESVDTERWRRIMDRFFALLCEGVHRFEGVVNKFTGDGIMALFGAPIAHEDHARRACYAALALADSLAAYSAELRREEGLNFSVRMGLNSGEVVVGTIGDDLRLGLRRALHALKDWEAPRTGWEQVIVATHR